MPVAVVHALIEVDLFADSRLEVLLPGSFVVNGGFFIVTLANVFIGALAISQLNDCYKQLVYLHRL